MADEPVFSDAAVDFAALMSNAAQAADADGDQAPYGFTRDRETGEMRAKKKPGRPRKPPSVEELKAAAGDAPAEKEPGPAPGDRAPDPRKRGKQKPPAPAYKPGVIHEGVNRLYRRAGRIVKAMDRDIGTAIIESTHDEEDGTGSVGWAWDQLAKTNPRVRAFLLKCLTGGAWGALVMAHAPIAMAVVMKDGIRRHIPFMRLVEAAAEPDEASKEGEGGLPGGMTAGDVQQMMGLAQQMMAQQWPQGRRGGPVTVEAAQE